jgi:hypothetical protein
MTPPGTPPMEWKPLSSRRASWWLQGFLADQFHEEKPKESSTREDRPASATPRDLHGFLASETNSDPLGAVRRRAW